MRNYASKETEEPRAAGAAQRHGSAAAARLQGRRSMRRDGGGRARAEYRDLDDQPAREGSGNASGPGAVPPRPRGLHADRRGTDRLRGNAAAAGLDGGISQQDRRHSRQDGRRTARRGVRQDGHQPERAAWRRDPPVRGRGARRRAEPARRVDQRSRARDHRRQLSGRNHSRAPQLGQPRIFGTVRRADAAVLRPPASAVRRAARKAHVDDDPQPRIRRPRLPLAEHGAQPSCEAHAQRDGVRPGIDRDADSLGPLSRLSARPLRGKFRKQGVDAADRAAPVQLPVPVREPAAALAATVARGAAVPVVPGGRACSGAAGRQWRRRLERSGSGCAAAVCGLRLGRHPLCITKQTAADAAANPGAAPLPAGRFPSAIMRASRFPLRLSP
ncbi:putative Xanthine and CO dehydrogenases maturation factor, XdhC/CoxF family [Burkholderia latens]